MEISDSSSKLDNNSGKPREIFLTLNFCILAKINVRRAYQMIIPNFLPEIDTCYLGFMDQKILKFFNKRDSNQDIEVRPIYLSTIFTIYTDECFTGIYHEAENYRNNATVLQCNLMRFKAIQGASVDYDYYLHWYMACQAGLCIQNVTNVTLHYPRNTPYRHSMNKMLCNIIMIIMASHSDIFSCEILRIIKYYSQTQM